MKIEKINHIGIAVRDLDAALSFWSGTLGLRLDRVEDVPSHQVKVAFLPAGDCDIELVMPTSCSTTLASDIQRTGGGLDHLCLEVKNLDEVLSELKLKGISLINETAVVLPGRKIAFVDPRSADGVLLEFYELTDSE